MVLISFVTYQQDYILIWILSNKFKSVPFNFEISIVLGTLHMGIHVGKKKHFKRITLAWCSENVSSRESFHCYFNNCVKTFCMAKVVLITSLRLTTDFSWWQMKTKHIQEKLNTIIPSVYWCSWKKYNP